MGELIVFLLIILLLIGSIFLIRAGIKAQKALNKKATDMGAKDILIASHVEGLGINQNAYCELYRFDDKLLIDTKSHKFEIQLNKLRAAELRNERELIEKGKSVVGRALIGTLIVPGLGTIVGGMSGIGTKKKKGTLNHFLIFNYEDDQGELAAVTFLNNINLIKVQKFISEINKSITTTSQDAVIQL